MLLRYFRNALITLSLATLLAGAAMGQVMTRVTGEIIGADGNPVEGAEIRIVRTDIRGNYSLKTDDKGKFLHATLPRGTYNIDVVIDGEVAVSVTDIQTNPNEAFPLNIDMREILKQQQAGIAPEAELSEADRLEMERRLKEAEEAAARDKALQDAFNVGMQAVQAKNWDVAIENLQAAGDVAPDQDVVWAQLAEAHIARGETRSGAARDVDYNLAVTSYAKAVALKPGDASLHNNYALALAKAQKFDEAEAELTQAATIDPAQAGKYFYNLGATYFNTGKNDQAESAFRRAIELQPDYAEVYYQLGTVLISKATLNADGTMAAPEGTKEAFDKYLELAPQGPNSDAAKGMLQALGSTVESKIVQ